MSYVDNNQLLEAMLASHMAGQITPDCYELFEDIVKQRVHAQLKHNVNAHKQDMIAFCMDKILRVWQNYTFDRDNPFAYFYTVIDNAIKLYFAKNQMQMQQVSIEEQDARFADD
jgi:hypothetical protein